MSLVKPSAAHWVVGYSGSALVSGVHVELKRHDTYVMSQSYELGDAAV